MPATAETPAELVAHFTIRTKPAERAEAIEEAIRLLTGSLCVVKGPGHVAQVLLTASEDFARQAETYEAA